MTNWPELLTDATQLHAIYGDEVPTLKQVELHEVLLHRDGPRLSLRFDVPEFPKSPPKKWAIAEFNRVQLTLLAIGVQAISLEGWSTQCKCNISVYPDGKLVGVRTEGGPTKIILTTDFLMISSINAYCDIQEGP